MSLLSSRVFPMSGLLVGAALALISSANASTPVAGPVLYQVTDLGTLGGDTSYAWAINNGGQIVGTSDTGLTDASGTPLKHAFRYDTSLHDLGTLPGVTQSVAFAVNASGQIAGYSGKSSVGSSGTHAFRYTPGSGFLDLGTFSNDVDQSYAFGLNSSGSVVGWSFPGFVQVEQPFLYNTSLRPYASQGDFLISINDSNVIAGSHSYSYGFETRDAAAIFANGGVLAVVGPSSTTSGGPNSYATAINNSGLAVGYLDYRNSGFGYQNLSHAFSCDTLVNTLKDLGTPTGTDTSRAFGVNLQGDAVGTAFTGDRYSSLPLTYIGSSKYQYATLFQKGNAYNLNDLLTGPNSAGWTLGSAQGINDGGQIVGFGTSPSGALHAFLLTPTTIQATGPFAPTGLQASAVPASAQINLSWTDNSGGHAFTVIERSTGAGYTQIALVSPGVITYSDYNVVAGTTYSYRIKAQSSIGASPYSTVASATTPSAATDVSTQIKVTRSGFRHAHGSALYGQTVTLTNTGAALSGPISLALDNLQGFVQSPTGYTQNALPSGSPYVNFAAGLGLNASVSVVLQFTLQSQGGGGGEGGPGISVTLPITYSARVLAGSGLR